jgi:hypothetical protein
MTRLVMGLWEAWLSGELDGVLLRIAGFALAGTVAAVVAWVGSDLEDRWVHAVSRVPERGLIESLAPKRVSP